MDTAFGFVGEGYVVLAADSSVTRSIIAYKHDEDKISELDGTKAVAAVGPQADRALFIEYIRKNIALYEYRTDLKLSTKAASSYVRNELAGALRKSPYHVDLLLGGYDKTTGPSLYFLDYLAACAQINYGAHGYARMFISATMDRSWRKGMTLEEGVALAKACILEIRTRMIVSQPHFVVKIITKDGIKEITDDVDPVVTATPAVIPDAVGAGVTGVPVPAAGGAATGGAATGGAAAAGAASSSTTVGDLVRAKLRIFAHIMIAAAKSAVDFKTLEGDRNAMWVEGRLRMASLACYQGLKAISTVVAPGASATGGVQGAIDAVGDWYAKAYIPDERLENLRKAVTTAALWNVLEASQYELAPILSAASSAKDTYRSLLHYAQNPIPADDAPPPPVSVASVAEKVIFGCRAVNKWFQHAVWYPFLSTAAVSIDGVKCNGDAILLPAADAARIRSHVEKMIESASGWQSLIHSLWPPASSPAGTGAGLAWLDTTVDALAFTRMHLDAARGKAPSNKGMFFVPCVYRVLNETVALMALRAAITTFSKASSLLDDSMSMPDAAVLRWAATRTAAEDASQAGQLRDAVAVSAAAATSSEVSYDAFIDQLTASTVFKPHDATLVTVAANQLHLECTRGGGRTRA